MRIAFFDTRSYDKASFTKANTEGGFNYEIDFRDFKLNENTALTAHDYDVVCVFVNDVVNAEVINILTECGVKLIALRLIRLMRLRNTVRPYCFPLPVIFLRHIFVQRLQTLIQKV